MIRNDDDSYFYLSFPYLADLFTIIFELLLQTVAVAVIYKLMVGVFWG